MTRYNKMWQTGGSGIATGGAAGVLVWLAGQYGLEIPPEVAATIAAWATGLIGMLANRFGPANAG